VSEERDSIWDRNLEKRLVFIKLHPEACSKDSKFACLRLIVSRKNGFMVKRGAKFDRELLMMQSHVCC
jgi:hypothetical protein